MSRRAHARAAPAVSGPRDGAWLLVAVAVDALLALADRAVGGIAGTFVLAPLLLAVVGRPRWAAAVGALSIVLAATSSVGTEHIGTAPYWWRLGFVAVGTALAVSVGERRCRAETGARRADALEVVAGVIDASLTAVLTMDAAGRVTAFNPAAADLFGHTPEHALGRELAELIVPPDQRARHREGLRRYLDTGQTTLLGRRMELDALHADGTQFPVELSITRVPGAEPSFAGFVRDLTDERRVQLHARLLSQTADLLASSTDYERTLREVAELAVPEIADWCGVALPTGDGRLDAVAVAHADPARLELARELRRRYPALPGNDPLQSIMRTGEPVWYPEIDEAQILAHARDERHLELLRAVGLGSVIMVPLRSGRRTVGTMSLVRTTPDRKYDERDLQFALELGRRAGAAVENARLYAERTEIAETLKAALKPPALPAMDGWDAAALYRPASRTSEVGGDFYDVFPAADGWMLVIGDVIGKGATAAALTSLARYSIRTAATLTGCPRAALEHLNADLAVQDRTALISALCVRLDETPAGARATIAAAGHPLPILVSGGTAQAAGRPSLLLGVEPVTRCAETTVELAGGDQLVLYTDGVLDVVGAHDRFGEGRLLALLEDGAPSAAAVVERTAAALEAFATVEQPDDIALLAVRRVARPTRPVVRQPVLPGRAAVG